MSKAKKSEFRPDDYVVYPAHGVGQIVSIEEQEIAGIKLELFVISFEKDKMTLRVPTNKATEIGMRSLSSPDVISKAMTTLKGKAKVKRAMWSPSPRLCAICIAATISASRAIPSASFTRRRLSV